MLLLPPERAGSRSLCSSAGLTDRSAAPFVKLLLSFFFFTVPVASTTDRKRVDNWRLLPSRALQPNSQRKRRGPGLASSCSLLLLISHYYLLAETLTTKTNPTKTMPSVCSQSSKFVLCLPLFNPIFNQQGASSF